MLRKQKYLDTTQSQKKGNLVKYNKNDIIYRNTKYKEYNIFGYFVIFLN